MGRRRPSCVLGGSGASRDSARTRDLPRPARRLLTVPARSTRGATDGGRVSVPAVTVKRETSERAAERTRIELAVGDIVSARADAIVTAAGAGSEGASLVQLALRRA